MSVYDFSLKSFTIREHSAVNTMCIYLLCTTVGEVDSDISI